MLNRIKLKKVLYLEKDVSFWTYADAVCFFNDICNDLTLDELKKLIHIIEIRYNIKKALRKESDTNV